MSAELQPVEIVHVRDHAFEKQARAGCARCKRAKTHPNHHGPPPTMNILGSGNAFLYQAIKKHWQPLLCDLIEQTDLPRPLARVMVEAEVTFPTNGKRDQGNFRGPLEKVLGDALKEGGWLLDDQWFPSSAYEFGNLSARYEKGVSMVRVTLFPDLSGVARDDDARQQLAVDVG